MSDITIKVDDREINAALLKLQAKLSNLAPTMKVIGEYMKRSTFDRFNAGGPAPDGTPWAPIQFPHPKARGPLRVTMHLRDSIRWQLQGNNAVAIGTNKIYAAIHQFGKQTAPHVIKPKKKKALFWPGAMHPVKSVKHPGSTIPARPYLGASQADINWFVTKIGQYVTG